MSKYKFENNSVSIIAYHYVREIKKSNYPNFKGVELKKFENHIKFFKKKFHIISADELTYFLEVKEKIKKPLVMLTFDDGYIDHYNHVLPILSKNKIKGCFYPPLNIFKGYLLNVNKIHYILNYFSDRVKLLLIIEDFLLTNFNFTIKKKEIKKFFSKKYLTNKIPEYDDEKTLLIKKLLQIILPKEIREKTSDYLLYKCLKLNEKKLSKELYLDIEQLKEINSEGMHIGSHGIEHEYWNNYDLDYQKKEISFSKSFFKKNDISVKNFSVCYPWGSYNEETKKLMKKTKISFGLTSNSGNFSLSSKIDKFFLPRLDANEFKNI